MKTEPTSSIPLNHPVLVEMMEAYDDICSIIRGYPYLAEQEIRLYEALNALRTLTEAAGTLPPQNALASFRKQEGSSNDV